MKMHQESRTEYNSETTALEAKLFRGLSDPSRLSILKILRHGERSVTGLVEQTGLSQPNVSGHLACLRDCGLVASRQEGRSVFYSLADERMEDIFLAAEDILARVAERIYRCTRYRS
ncbi:MAG: hypothetical protein KatS3mg015_0893 [Fimbriimonadales bacterium]|jgi:ArsR family transcriptional regulator, cadmium/lead-responsive transcriptional repressor|nr:MAG: hypothetical protein KatS3mg015_0893 [Fimbriimonadales bacterium]